MAIRGRRRAETSVECECEREHEPPATTTTNGTIACGTVMQCLADAGHGHDDVGDVGGGGECLDEFVEQAQIPGGLLAV